MSYKVIESFCDMNDNSFQYSSGDTYPRQGAEASQARLNELASSNNKLGRPLIKVMAVKPAPMAAVKPVAKKEPRSRKSKKSE